MKTIFDSKVFSNIYKAMDLISHDSGNGAGHTEYMVDIELTRDQLLAIDKKLGQLTDEELETFTIGEHTEMSKICKDMDLKPADDLMSEFFNYGICPSVILQIGTHAAYMLPNVNNGKLVETDLV